MNTGLILFCGCVLLYTFILIFSHYKFPFAPIQYSISANNFEELKLQIEKELLNNYFKSGSEKLYENMGTVYGYSMKGFMHSEDIYLINMAMNINEDGGYKSIKNLNHEILATYPPIFRTRGDGTIFIYCFDYISEEIVTSVTSNWRFLVTKRSNAFDYPLFISFDTKTAYSINFNNKPPKDDLSKVVSHSWNKQFKPISSLFEQKF